MGQEAELSLDDKWANLDKFLADYRAKFHLDKIHLEEVDISTTVQEIKKLHPEDIAQRILEWGIYSFAIQSKINELKAKLTWVSDNLDRYWGIHQKTISREYGFTAQDRKMLLLENDVYCEKLYYLRTEINVKLTQLEYLPNQVNFLTKIAQQVMESKWRELNGNRRS
jgi:hypothetical protein